MDEKSEQLHDEPTVDDLRVKLCYICREEEHHDSPPHPATVWLHPCKCTLVAHESCLLHWIKTQQREFGRTRGDLKCPQCGELYEFEGFNPRILRIFNSANRILSRCGRVMTGFFVGTAILSSGAGIYLTCASYGAFAVREFVGPDIFQAVLTSNPTNWPLHAWFYLPLIPFSLVISRTSLIVWTSNPLVPLLFPWPSTLPVSAIARGGSRVQLGLWPPPPALVCALFPFVRYLYGQLRNRLIKTMVHNVLTPPEDIRPLQQRLRRAQQGIQEQDGDQQERLQRLRIHIQARRQQQQQQQQPQRQPQQPQQQQQVHAGPGAGRRFRFQLGELFGFEIAHFIFDRNPPPPGGPFGPAPAPAPALAVVDGAANGDNGRAVDNPADRQQEQPRRDVLVQVPERDPPVLAPADQEPQQQQQQQPPPPEPQQPQRAEPGQGQGQEPLPPARDEDDLGGVAQRAIRATGASVGRSVGGALLFPSIARMMGSMLLHISHVVPLVRTIIAPLPPPLPPPPFIPPHSGPISTLVRLIRGTRVDTVRVVQHGYVHGWLNGSGFGALFLRGLLATSQEWASSDPVWWRNALGLGIFLVVKDGFKLFHLWLAKRELEERHIKNKSFAGIDLTELDLVERRRPEET